MTKNWIAVFSTLLITACTSNIDPEDYAGALTDNFKTDIREDGLKLFVYSAKQIKPTLYGSSNNNDRPPQQGDQRGGRGGNERGSTAQRSTNNDNQRELFERQVELGLERTLKQNQYCKEGFFELSRLIEGNEGKIRGECRDGATQSDREKFK